MTIIHKNPLKKTFSETILFDKKQDKIAIIAPSSLSSEAEGKFAAALSLLEDAGFSVVYHPEIISGASLEFFAATKYIRTESLKIALEDDRVKIIWAFRGGYGATEIVFDCYECKPSTPKLLIGFSDITALHLLFNQRYQLPSLHASVLTSLLGDQKKMFAEIMELFTAGKKSYELEMANDSAINIDSTIEAEIIGGNLAVFCNMIGTKLHPCTDGKIVILEDVGERGYEIHRLFMHLINSGLLTRPAAIILGDFTNGDEHVKPSIDDICYRYLRHIPIYNFTGFGHGSVNHPVILGSKSKIDKNYLLLESPLTIN